MATTETTTGGGDRPTTTLPPPGPPAVRVRGLHCRYGDFEAVRGVDLDVLPGRVLAVLGTNGAGKTTTLEAVEGHRRADGGTVEVLGVDPWQRRRDLATRLGVLFQEPSTPDDLTPVETLSLWLRLHGHTGDDVAPTVDAALTLADLAHRRDVRVRQLSGGERRRLDLALVLATDPEVVLLDEPTTGLDPESRERAWRTIRAVAERGAAVVLTTHYLDEAEALADTVAILHAGRVVVAGALDEVRAARPARIAFRVPTAAPPLPPLAGTPTATDAPDGGTDVAVATGDLQADLTTLLTWAAGAGVALDRLEARSPSLAEVFREVAEAHDDRSTTGGTR
jgi:ABC-2 type transport system ATP-binding protein